MVELKTIRRPIFLERLAISEKGDKRHARIKKRSFTAAWYIFNTSVFTGHFGKYQLFKVVQPYLALIQWLWRVN